MNKVPRETAERQALAADPSLSAWVSANAGSGKTFVLARRVIRLMLAGVAPAKILCLTFTKAAAAEMSDRVFKILARWTMMSDEVLKKELHDVLNRQAYERESERARLLFALALDTPGGLKIQTIHAFCEAVLHQFPLEANIPADFDVIDDQAQNLLLGEAQIQTILGAVRDPVIAEAMETLRSVTSDDGIEKALQSFVSKQEYLSQWIGSAEGVEQIDGELKQASGLPKDATVESVVSGSFLKAPVDLNTWQLLKQEALADGSKTQIKFADLVDCYLDEADQCVAINTKSEILLTQKREARAKILSAKLATKYPEIVVLLEREQLHHLETLEKLDALYLTNATKALFIIGKTIVDRYQRAKRTRGLVDYSDLINRTANLLTRNNIHEWVQYKLDRGIDHILVDEAQDTSPTQWEIINALNDDFFDGENASFARRSMFAVGDKKQSIYSFQGARPDEFYQQERNLKKRVENGGNPFKQVSLNLSFRSTSDVMEAVDHVFNSTSTANSGLGEDDGTIHQAFRKNSPGEVVLWEPYIKPTKLKTEKWLQSIDVALEEDSAVRLANRIATQVKFWIGRPLPGTGKPIRAGDIMVLVRKRDRFVKAVTRSLKSQSVPVSGTDRLKLSEHIAIEDLTALGRFVANKDDDLSLAAVLKSPLFDLDEETLFSISYDRKNLSLYDNMNELALSDGSLAKMIRTVCDSLSRLLTFAAEYSVHDFYAHVLSAMGGRRKFLARLGGEVEDVLDAFLAKALEFEKTGALGLDSFLQVIVSNAPDIKRTIDANRNEVRILTVHSSKGLEAPIVFMVDPCTAPYSSQHRPQLREIPLSDGRLGWLWQPNAEFKTALLRTADEQTQRQAEEEYHRLLYVGMTRAADRLVICGYAGVRGADENCWYRLVERELKTLCKEQTNPATQETEWMFQVNPNAKQISKIDGEKHADHVPEHGLPTWINQPAPFEPPLPKPLSPSGVFALMDGGEERFVPSGEKASTSTAQHAIARGNATHSLLQYLPLFPTENWEELARSFLTSINPEFDEATRYSISSEVLAIMRNDKLADLFGPESQAEVALAGTLRIGGRERIVSGQIDRMIAADEKILIVDYKTNRQVPDGISQVPKPYLAQMALYREILRNIYPKQVIECLLLWTANCSAMPITEQAIHKTLVEIKAV